MLVLYCYPKAFTVSHLVIIKQAWPQASHQLNPALLTRMLIPVQLYCFPNLNLISPSKSNRLTFLPVLTTSSIMIDKCKKNCSLSTTYNGEMTHRKQQK